MYTKRQKVNIDDTRFIFTLSLIHISEPTRRS